MTSTSTVGIVSLEVAHYFEELGLFKPIQGKKRKVSPSTISQGNSAASSDSTSRQFMPTNLIDGSSIFASAAIHQFKEFIEIPVFLQSQETIEFIGFTSEKAQNIWNLWEGVPDNEKSSRTFLEFILEFISDPGGSLQAINSDDDWNAYMDNIGISSRLKTAILLPEYEIIRYTSSCEFWLLDSVECTYRALESLTERFEISAEYFRSTSFEGSEKKRTRRARSLSKGPSLPSPTSRKQQNANSPARGDVERQDSDISGNKAVNRLTTYYGDPDSLSGQSEAAEEEASMLVSTRKKFKLYRATNLSKAKAFYDEKTGLVREGRFGSIPGDLSGHSLLTYWTPQRKVADIYAGYLKHRTPISEVIVTEVEITEELVASLQPVYLWGQTDKGINPHFQEFTWSCRKGYQKNEMPSYLKYLTKCHLIIAHILTNKNVKYEKMDSWKDIKVSDLLHTKIDGEEKLGIQWAFRSSDAKSAFNEHCHGNIKQYNLNMLTIAPYSQFIETEDGENKTSNLRETCDLQYPTSDVTLPG
ncbi:hypothetical protein AOL_s00210g84 [Orbilia oligospora ATCC 24927]|uniref:Uncharacterized protein n=1 Tax=Arthrobotrys oligospora (strain ATCC 24927 / CBS 115.81 / DSM 1491) TaxID=756982 RepID=G1XRS6_ARTOA|nr:hypothetical protein AOL_s00210g84 [Orbilia oligospora ATCC 24927]EGX44103.1 hypothetical protein AOL_s00210g84 [Orbilia oligospora ATCC 24927]